jgi:hypothetical protein
MDGLATTEAAGRFVPTIVGRTVIQFGDFRPRIVGLPSVWHPRLRRNCRSLRPLRVVTRNGWGGSEIAYPTSPTASGWRLQERVVTTRA